MLQVPERYSKCVEILESHARPSGPLFHYTNKAGLVGILQSQQLWLTEYAKLNDAHEIQYGVQIIREHIFSQVISENIRLFWDSIFTDIHTIVSNIFDFYICSFCMEQNHPYAWQNYANDGAGFSIGFKKEFFIGYTELPEEHGDAPNFGRGKVYYDYNFLAKYIIDLVNIVQNDLIKENALRNTEDAKIKRDYIAKYFWVTLFPFLISLKRKIFEKEREHRIYTSMPQSISLQKLITYDDNPDLPHSNAKKRVYFNFDLQNISEIWVGSKLDFEPTKHEIEKILSLLRTQGKRVEEIKIIDSKTHCNTDLIIA
jgi:DUF2971 family protein